MFAAGDLRFLGGCCCWSTRRAHARPGDAGNPAQSERGVARRDGRQAAVRHTPNRTGVPAGVLHRPAGGAVRVAPRRGLPPTTGLPSASGVPAGALPVRSGQLRLTRGTAHHGSR